MTSFPPSSEYKLHNNTRHRHQHTPSYGDRQGRKYEYLNSVHIFINITLVPIAIKIMQT